MATKKAAANNGTAKKAAPRKKAAPKDPGADYPLEPGKCNEWVPRHKRRCRNPAGKWTDHEGVGACKMHENPAQAQPSTALTTMQVLRTEAIEYTKSIAAEKAINPIDAMLWAVRLSAGAVQFWFDTLGTLEDGTPTELALAIEEAYGKERDRLVRSAQAAISIGLAEKQIRLAERQADLMLLVLEETFEQYGIPLDRIDEAKTYAAGVASALVVAGFGSD